jgi:alpha-beta hydrolase superfamily lysophospholipase
MSKGQALETFFVLTGGLVAIVICTLAGMIAFGTRNPPPPLASMNGPLEKIDFSDLPALRTIPSNTGSPIAFREWKTASKGEPEFTLILIHGSSGSSTSLHPLGKALSAAGILVCAPDIRGHGKTGRTGDIDYSQQLDDDFRTLLAEVKARQPRSRLVLAGFSAGGGFALHAAALPAGKSFERAVLISPMLGMRAPTVSPCGNEWAKPFMPRILALLVLNHIGIHAFDYLPALAFAIPPQRTNIFTGQYSWRLLRAFYTADYVADLKMAPMPIHVLVGEQDELFSAERFEPAVHAPRPDAKVTVIAALNHMEMTTDPRAVPALVTAIRGGA